MNIAWRILTPEHVELQLVPAPLGSRVLAALLDLILCMVLASGAMKLAAWLTPESIAPAIGITASFLLFWGYPVWFEMRWHGQTPGKRMLGLRAVDDRGLPLDIGQCLVRSVVRLIDLLPGLGGAGLIIAWFDPWQRRLGDIAASTMVVAERATCAPPAELDLSLRQSSLDTPRFRRLVRHRIGLEERELILALLLRANALEASARYDLMERVGALLRRRLGVEPIEGLSGESWVRGIAALCWRTALPNHGRQRDSVR